MDLESVKRLLEKEKIENGDTIDSLPLRFFETLILQGLHVDDVKPGLLLCSMIVPSRLLNNGNFLHGGATATLVDVLGSAVLYTLGATKSGVSVEINVSYLDAAYAGEEIEIESKVLRLGKTIAVASVELRKKKTGKIVAQGRHTKFISPTAPSITSTSKL